VREAIFASLGGRVIDAVVLDLFAGSGALGLEALSRGAAGVVFVERSRPALTALRRNIGSVGAEKPSRIVAGSVFDFLAGRHGNLEEVGVVFADPPYEETPADLTLQIAEAPALTWVPHGIMVVEMSVRQVEGHGIPGWRRWAARTYGETRVTIDERKPDAEGIVKGKTRGPVSRNI
jgi:16S rRNA (guanine(966)-N(2))-methyltransferase RsmD